MNVDMTGESKTGDGEDRETRGDRQKTEDAAIMKLRSELR